MNLKNKIALVTGASRRIGRETALQLAARGCDILIHRNHSRSEAQSLKKEIESSGRRAWILSADFNTKRKSVKKQARDFLSEALKLAGDLHILVNNAAIYHATPFGKISDQDWDVFQHVNLKVPFFLAQECGIYMKRKRRGKIINLVDWVAPSPHSDFIPYGISKAGLLAATRGLAKALAPAVQVNAIAPGPILPAEKVSAAQRKAAVKLTLLEKYGHPSDIAKTVLYLCEATDYVTGAVIHVDGGSAVSIPR